MCNGQLLPINQNQPLFALLGTTYGGNGQTTFGLPTSRGACRCTWAARFQLGNVLGSEFETLTVGEMPAHIHPMSGSSAPASVIAPTGNAFATSPGNVYRNGLGTSATALMPATIGNFGGSQPHENRQPFLVITFLYRPHRHLPEPELRNSDGPTVHRRDQDVRGELRPVGWRFCNGQPLAIAENESLFNLIGTTYGGDGQATFNLPDLQGRLPIHFGTLSGGQTYTPGEAAGAEQATLNTNQIPVHNHSVIATTAAGDQASPAHNVLAASPAVALYNSNAPNQALRANSLAPSGGSQPHDNLQPYLCLSFIICLSGLFPQPS